MSNEKVLVSACLIGQAVRYDGKSKEMPYLMKLYQEGRAIPICPEVQGGLPVPRVPSEQQGDKVINKRQEDVTEYFIKGANIALTLAKEHQIQVAILKSKSPSCGSKYVYDGTFRGTLIEKDGVAAKALKAAGIRVMDEQEGELWYEQHQ